MMFLSNVFSMFFQIFCFSEKHDESLVVLSAMLSCFIVCLQATTWLDIELDLQSQMANLVLFRTGLLKCTQHETLKTYIRNIRGDVFFQVWKAHRFYFKVPSCCLSWADTLGVDEEKSWRLDQRFESYNLLKPFAWRLLEQRHWRFSHRNFQKTWKEQWCSSTAS